MHHLREGVQGIVARGVEFERSFYQRSRRLIDHVNFVSFFSDGFVSERWFGREPALSNLFFLTLADFFGEVVGVEAGNDYFHIPDEVFMSPRVLVDDEGFFHEMYLPFGVSVDPIDHARRVFEVASEAVYFLAENNRYSMFDGVLQHLVESFSNLFSACRFGDTKYFDDSQVVFCCVLL